METTCHRSSRYYPGGTLRFGDGWASPQVQESTLYTFESFFLSRVFEKDRSELFLLWEWATGPWQFLDLPATHWKVTISRLCCRKRGRRRGSWRFSPVPEDPSLHCRSVRFGRLVRITAVCLGGGEQEPNCDCPARWQISLWNITAENWVNLNLWCLALEEEVCRVGPNTQTRGTLVQLMCFISGLEDPLCIRYSVRQAKSYENHGIGESSLSRQNEFIKSLKTGSKQTESQVKKEHVGSTGCQSQLCAVGDGPTQGKTKMRYHLTPEPKTQNWGHHASGESRTLKPPAGFVCLCIGHWHPEEVEVFRFIAVTLEGWRGQANVWRWFRSEPQFRMCGLKPVATSKSKQKACSVIQNNSFIFHFVDGVVMQGDRDGTQSTQYCLNWNNCHQSPTHQIQREPVSDHDDKKYYACRKPADQVWDRAKN